MRKFCYCFNTVNSYTFLFISLPKHNYFMNIIPPPYYKNLFGGFSCVEKLNRSFVLREMFHVDQSGTDWVTLCSFKPLWWCRLDSVAHLDLNKKKASLGAMRMSALPHMANPAAAGLGRERPHSGSDFFQSWPKWKHLVLIRDSGCDSCSGSCEDLAVGCNADCGTRTKYTNISTVIMCQVKQAIEGSGWMCWEGVLSERAWCVS